MLTKLVASSTSILKSSSRLKGFPMKTKTLRTLVLAASLLAFGTPASAIDFKIKGEWLFAFGAIDTGYVKKTNSHKVDNNDHFAAVQRTRLQLDAIASESLSGTVMFEIGDTIWGKDTQGGALGADGKTVEVRWAYIDWIVPDTALSLRMGLQYTPLPYAAGGSSIWDDDSAAIVASYKFNDHVAVTAMWSRPYNDNYTGSMSGQEKNYLDNVDLFMLSVPVTMDGFKITPWAMGGMLGKNHRTSPGMSGTYFDFGTRPFPYSINSYQGGGIMDEHISSKDYGFAFWAGLPIVLSQFDPFVFEVDFNYGYVEENGRYSIQNQRTGAWSRGSTQREGWLIKALAEYKLDWATLGLFGWYASGDDDSLKNGSEQMPSVSPSGFFTSFIGDGFGWSTHSGRGVDQALSYAGTWGIGAHIKNVSFFEDLTHTLRVAYWGGTNHTKNVEYLGMTDATSMLGISPTGFYLTTEDYLIELTLDSVYDIYDNLQVRCELGYVINGIDQDVWAGKYRNSSYQKSDGYKAALIFKYSF